MLTHRIGVNIVFVDWSGYNRTLNRFYSVISVRKYPWMAIALCVWSAKKNIVEKSLQKISCVEYIDCILCIILVERLWEKNTMHKKR